MDGKGILFLLLISTFSFGQELKCNEIEAEQPTVAGTDVLFSFERPQNTETHEMIVTDVTWYVAMGNTGSGISVDNIPEKFETSLNILSRKYYLKFLTADKTYSRMYINFRTAEEYCSSPNLEISWIDIENCGYMYARTDTIIEDKPYEIGLIPNLTLTEYQRSALKISILSNNTWEVIATGLNDRKFTQVQDRNEYILTVEQADPSSFMLDVSCGIIPQIQQKLQLTIITKPEPPELLDVVSIDSCERCIVANINLRDRFQVHCKTTGGTLPVSVTMYHKGSIITKKEVYDGNAELSGSIMPADSAHLTDIRCEVMNQALDEPLTVRSQIYIKVPPKTPQWIIGTLKEGKGSNITCLSDGRPPPSLILSLNNVNLKTTVLTAQQKDGMYMTSISYAEDVTREMHRKKLKCCTNSTAEIDNCSPSSVIKVFFPPLSVTLTKSFDSDRPADSYILELRCSINESNPECDVAWGELNSTSTAANFQRPIRVQTSGGFYKHQSAQITITKRDHNRTIKCQAKCPEFPELHMADTVILDVPYKPEFVIMPRNTSVKTGQPVEFRCQLDGNPMPSVLWIGPGNKTMNITEVSMDSQIFRLRLQKPEKPDAGYYTCVADNKFHPEIRASAYLDVEDTLYFTDSSGTEKREGKDGEDFPLYWIAVILVALMVLVIVVIVVVLKSKRKLQGDGPKATREEGEKIPLQEGGIAQGNVQQMPNHIYGNFNAVEQAGNEDGNAGNESPEAVEYAVAVPRSQRQSQSHQYMNREALQQQVPKGGQELIYADLDLDNPTPSTSGRKPEIHRQESATEYGMIDFTKKAEPLPADDEQ